MPKEETKKYYVSSKAGGWVAGKRSPGFEEPMDLTAAQAETPLRNGEIYITKAALSEAENKHAALVKEKKVIADNAVKKAKDNPKEDAPAKNSVTKIGDAK